MDKPLHVLVLDDSATDAELIQRELRKAGFVFTAQIAQDKATFLQALDVMTPDILLADYSLPGFDGLSALALARERLPDVPGIIVSGAIGEETAIEALKGGAADYVLKQRLNRLGPVVQRALREARQLREKKLAQEALRENEERLRLLVKGVKDYAIFTLDPEGRVDSWNEGAQQIKGWTTQEVIGQSVSLFYEPEAVAAGLPRAELERAAAQGSCQDEGWRMRKDGSRFWASVTITALRDDQGRLRGFSKITRDITDRKRAEEALRESERFRRAVLDSLPAKIAVLDAHGVVLAVNERWKELEIGSDYLGFCRRAAATGEASAVEGLAVLESVLKGETPEGSVEYPCHTATEQQWFMMQAVHASEQVGGAIVSHVDITARMKAEELVRQSAEELKRSNHDLEQFAYIAGHDLQEPLRMVTGLMGLLRDGYKGKQLDAKADQYIDFAADGAHRMSIMIKDLLEYSRTGSKGLKLAPVDIADIVSAVRANLRRIIEETKAVVTHDPLPTVTADMSQMLQVFQNLIGNAIKFRSPDRPCQVHVGAKRLGGEWLFWVRDSGIGIDPKQADRIFKLFQRLHTRDKYPGSGIGLAICRKIVERHGGRIWVESTPGEGSTFYFTLSGATGSV